VTTSCDENPLLTSRKSEDGHEILGKNEPKFNRLKPNSNRRFHKFPLLDPYGLVISQPNWGKAIAMAGSRQSYGPTGTREAAAAFNTLRMEAAFSFPSIGCKFPTGNQLLPTSPPVQKGLQGPELF